MSSEIALILNYLVERRYFPQSWFVGKRSAIHKEGIKSYVNNYRGVTILPIMEKVILVFIEKFVIGEICKHLLENHFFKNFGQSWKARSGPIIIQKVGISFFLNRGTTWANLRLSGKIPVHSDWFIITVKGSTSMPFILLMSLEEMSSGPPLVLAVRSSKCFCTRADSKH